MRFAFFPLVLAAAALVASASDARDESCSAAREWRTMTGTLRPRHRCGAFLAATDGSMEAFSYAFFTFQKRASIPFTFTTTMQRLGPERRALEIFVLGAAVLLEEEQCGLYVPTDDIRFDHDGWKPLPGFHTHEEHRVSVRQTLDRIELSIDGRRAASWDLRAPHTNGNVSFGFKGASGYRSWVAFGDARLDAQ
jgi:hypothetical protein